MINFTIVSIFYSFLFQTITLNYSPLITNYKIKTYINMIKVKNLSNVQDDESITMEKLNSFIPEKQLKTKKKIRSSLNRHNHLLEKWQDDGEVEGMSSINSQCGLIPGLSQERRPGDETSQYSEFIQNRKRKKRQNPTQLKQIITQQKIKIIVRNFINKLLRNNINSKPVEFSPFHSDMQIGFLQTEGIELHDYVNLAFAMFSALQIVILSIIYTLSIVFDEVNNTPIVQGFQSFSLAFYLIEIGLNFVTVKFQQGRRLSTFRQIWSFYLKDNFPVDLISIIILFVDLFGQLEVTIYLRLFIIVKLSQGLEKVEKMEVFFIHNFYNQQYWSLIKVFLFNFSFAHILAIFLIAMAKINEHHNWMTANKDIYLAPWFEKYAWSYYWATTMMLTVGFGDLAATTYHQAIILTLIQMISCICLAYNINCVGTLISNIRSQDVQKSKNFKIFRKLTRKNDVSEDLQWRINNYIEESSNIKKKFNYEEENMFVQKLPKGLRTQFLKQSNKKIFQNLPFFKNLMERTLFSFAQKIQMHICHPEQIIQRIDDPHNLLILKGGQIGFTCKKVGCEFNSTIIDQLRITKMCEPVLMSLGFIRHYRPLYEIKSLEYSILYFLDHEMILSILKGSEMDYELYCLLRDKCSHVPDEFQLFNCQMCTGRHTKFTCPKLHFIPIRQHVTNKYIHKFKTHKNKRGYDFQRFESKKYSALKIYFDMNQDQTKKSTLLKENTKKQRRQSNNVLSQRNKFQEIQQNSNTIIKQLSDIKDFFSRNTAELIKHEMNKALLNGEAPDQVWIIESDKMKNYKNYFEADNSCNLIDKFNIQKRTGTFSDNDDFWSELRSREFITGQSSTKQNIQVKQRSAKSKMTLRTSYKTLKTIGSKNYQKSQQSSFAHINSTKKPKVPKNENYLLNNSQFK